MRPLGLRFVPLWFRHLVVVILGSLAIAVLLAPYMAKPARGAPRPHTQQECAIVADIAVTAGALAQEVDRATADRVVARIYDLTAAGKAIADAGLKAAYRDKPDPQLFATALMQACMRSGDMSGILGVGI